MWIYRSSPLACWIRSLHPQKLQQDLNMISLPISLLHLRAIKRSKMFRWVAYLCYYNILEDHARIQLPLGSPIGVTRSC